MNSLDRFIIGIDRALRTLAPGSTAAERPNPAGEHTQAELGAPAARHSAGLMRINHTGEVCAQALYQGQALTAQLPQIRHSMEQAAQEESDHLAWCESRLQELGSRPSLLNPLWYTMSFGLGAAAGLAGDKWSLGFVAETEDQVCSHLRSHLERLPEDDTRSKAILEQMLVDEGQHASTARAAGAATLPMPVKGAMTAMAQVMKTLVYRI
ncbi:MAG TPA: 2-polyprenyl-3-methyl-6-methoxy-1,4-benzoquinone monooxygenase [Hyphomicrobiales bacterium]|nr:2-polyprenyl-3-methyl-6-methoxy-1,4-benzoquinone monooxygenase [Hyphomicrobiales bacterium]